jgi:hypothetical protein
MDLLVVALGKVLAAVGTDVFRYRRMHLFVETFGERLAAVRAEVPAGRSVIERLVVVGRAHRVIRE